MRAYILPFMLFLFIHSYSSSNKLWFQQPAPVWENALPIGNGRLGAMVFGEPIFERIQLNEETVWTGHKGQYRDNPNAFTLLPQIRQLLFDGKYAEAQEITEREFMGEGNWNMYQTLGDFFITSLHGNKIEEYTRELDLEEAIVRVAYTVDGVHYLREYFSSYPDQAIVVRITSSKKNALSVSAWLTRPKDASIVMRGNEIRMFGQVTAGGVDMKDVNPGVKYHTVVKALTEKGKVTSKGDSIIIRNANAITFYISACTDYWGKNPEVESQKTISAILSKKYNAIKTRHIADYQSYFKRVSLSLGSNSFESLPTDKRLLAVKNGGEDNYLAKQYFDFGRYLLISSSRPGDLAANLQGIWADGLVPPWSADYHININIQMNYWPAEVTNLSECHLPFIDLLDSLRTCGRQTAKSMYGSRGFVAHFTTDAWYWTTAVGKAEWGMWPMGAAWCCQHIWQHYLFTYDKDFLKMAYPILKEASLFFMDYLTTDPETGFLVTGPSSSPENKFLTPDGKISNITMGPTMDMSITRELLSNTIQAANVLSIDTDFRSQLAAILPKLSPLRIGSDGRIMEWTKEFDEQDPGHRHISHLYGLFPGYEISTALTPEYARAARKTIDYRLSHGGGHTGWSRAWIINFFARLEDGDIAYENLLALFRKSTLDNLFDNHPPFQIDGNFGATAGIAEMLLQSHANEICLLPALPKAWPNGKVTGLKARGNFEVEIEWENGILLKAKIKSLSGTKTQLRYGDKVFPLSIPKGETFSLNN